MQLTPRPRVWPWALVLSCAVLAAYWNAFQGVFLLDDISNITQNSTLRDLSALGRVLFAYPNMTRPLVSFTLAFDVALFGNNPAGYHACNIAAHLGGALLLFGIARRALSTGRAAFVERLATPLAFCAALLWALHPLQTESVTYIIQRAESMMGFFFLLSLYAVIRGAESADRVSSSVWNKWNALAVLAAVLGAGCKQVIATLPLIALLYDRCFISGSFKSALKRAPALYAGLCLSWVVIAALLALVPAYSSAGFALKKISALGYAQSQFVIILHYLKLCFWPLDLCLDYVWMVERDYTRIIPCAAAILALCGVTIWQLIRNTAEGFWGAWFFVILAPSSSILPIGDLAFEHRLYLPLAAVSMLLVPALYRAARALLGSQTALRATLGVSIPIALALGVLTVRRNMLYHSNLAMWQDVLVKRPRNPRALLVLGHDALAHDDLKTARADFERALEAQSEFHETHASMGELLLSEERPGGAILEFRRALELNPKHAQSFLGLIQALRTVGKLDEATQILTQAAALFPAEPQLQSDFGRMQFQTRHYPEAIAAFELALNQAPDSAELHNSLGGALAATGKIPEALAEFEQALKHEPRSATALYNRGNALERLGRIPEAAQSFAASLNVNAEQAGASNALAWILATNSDEKLRDGKKAVALAERACALTQRASPLMLDTLAAAYAEAGNFEAAQAAAESALKLLSPAHPQSVEIKSHLELFAQKKPLRK